MSTLGEKYRKVADEDEQKRAEKARLEKIEQKKREHEALLMVPQMAQKVIEKIPQIIEEATKNGKRVGEITLAGDFSDFESHGFWTPYWLPKKSTIARLVFDYCVKQGLRPEVTQTGGFSKDSGRSPSIITIRW